MKKLKSIETKIEDKMKNTSNTIADEKDEDLDEVIEDDEGSDEVIEDDEGSDEVIEDDEGSDEVIEDDEDLENSTEEIDEDSKEVGEFAATLKNRFILFLNKKEYEKISFLVRMAVAIIGFICAAIIIKPTNPGLFYKFYYLVFILFSVGTLLCCFIAYKDISILRNFYKNFKSSLGRKEDLFSNDKNINRICNAYSESFLLNETYNKTRSNADLYFGSETYFNDMNKLPIQAFLKIIPGTFIGFGILGTFIGFASGLSSINIANSESLLNGVQELLNGLKNAFNTSIVGVFASMFLNYVMVHPLFNRLDSCSRQLCDYLDTKFFVSEVDAMAITDSNNRKIPFPQAMGIVLEKLEQVASNINQMGATVGEQVTQSVKATLDKTIEKIIKEEIKKLREEMKTSISLLQECQKQLQNAPVHLKEATEKMRDAALKNDELFRKESQEFVETLIESIERNLNEKFGAYAKAVEDTSEEILNIKNTLTLIPEELNTIIESLKTTTDKLSENQATLGYALGESAQAFDKTVAVSESLNEAYTVQSNKMEQMISKFTTVLDEYKEISKGSKELLFGYKGMDEQIANIFEKINDNTKNYSDIIGNSLSRYLNSFTNATKGISAKFADATDALREEVEKLNKSEKTR